MSSTNKAYPL